MRSPLRSPAGIPGPCLDQLDLRRRARRSAGRSFDAVVLDLDDTLTLGNSLLEVSSGLGISVETFAEFGRRCRGDALDQATAGHELLALLTSRGPVFRAALKSHFARIRLRPTAAALVRSMRESGHQVGLISSSFDLYVQQMAGRLGIADHYSNVGLGFDGAGALVRVSLCVEAAELKHRQLHRFCAMHRLDPSRVLVVGDNDNDLRMFACTGRGVLLDCAHNRDLRPLAWQVVTHIDDVATLL